MKTARAYAFADMSECGVNLNVFTYERELLEFLGFIGKPDFRVYNNKTNFV